MIRPKYFKSQIAGKLRLPVFFPDATRGFVRSIDTQDLEETKTEGVLVNTYHLYKELGLDFVKNLGGIRKYMNYEGAVISDSGGFQVGSLIKKNPQLGYVNNKGVTFKMPGQPRMFISPEDSITFQMQLGVDMVVALDDFDPPNATETEIKKSVDRTILWAKRSKDQFLKICKKQNIPQTQRPYILGVIQGGRSKRLRKYCFEELQKIGFDGYGYGGEEKIRGNINNSLAKYIRDLVPDDKLLYALGVGKPEDIVTLSKIGYQIFDCVIPTRDARHGRLYTFNFDSIDQIDLNIKEFYKTFSPSRKYNMDDFSKISSACDCLTCRRYTKSYVAHLFRIGDAGAGRLATIHNLRFYSILIQKIREQIV